MWEREQKIIKGLKKLYPDIKSCWAFGIAQLDYDDENFWQAAWVSWLCVFYLNSRMPSIENFLKKNNNAVWGYYKHHFRIKESECGKKN